MSGAIEVYRNSVQTWECDQMGHMNVQFYLAKATTALNSLAVRLGLGPAFQRGQGARLLAEDHHIRFLREQHAGTPIAIAAGILDSSPEQLRVFAEMYNGTSGEPAATFVANVGLFDSQTLEARALPRDALAAAEGFRVDLPRRAEPKGIEVTEPRAAPTLREAETLGLRRTFEGEVTPAMVDRHGYLNTGAYMGIVSDAYPNVFALTDGGQLEDNHGGAAVEYRFIYRARPRAGDVLTLRSAVKAVSEKTYSFCHWLFDAETGTSVATAEVVAVTLDLQARRAVPVPPAVREALSSGLISGLSV